MEKMENMINVWFFCHLLALYHHFFTVKLPLLCTHCSNPNQIIACLLIFFLEASIYFEGPRPTQYSSVITWLGFAPSACFPSSHLTRICVPSSPSSPGLPAILWQGFEEPCIIPFQSVMSVELITSHSSSVNTCWALPLSGRHGNWVLSHFPLLGSLHCQPSLYLSLSSILSPCSLQLDHGSSNHDLS